jgi:anti-sigma-K factor RskA
MTNEEHLALMDKLTPYVLGELSRQEAAYLRDHLESCDTCRREFREVSEGLVLLGLTATGPSSPARSRDRLLHAVGIADRPVAAERPALQPVVGGVQRATEYDALLPVYAPMRRPWWNFVPAFAAVVLAAFAILLWVNNAHLRDRLAEVRRQNAEAEKQLAEARMIADALTSPLTQKVTLVSKTQKPAPLVNTMYSPNHRAIMVIAENMPPVAPDKAYQLWLLPANGAPPMAAGTFRPNAKGSAMMMHTNMAATPVAKGFAITVEAAEGSDRPTSPIMMSGL